MPRSRTRSKSRAPASPKRRSESQPAERRRRRRKRSENRLRSRPRSSSPPQRSRSGSGKNNRSPKGRSPPPRSPRRRKSRSAPARSRDRSRSRLRSRSRRRSRGRRRNRSRSRTDGGNWSQPRGRREPYRPKKPEGCKTIWVGWVDKKPEEEELQDFFKDCGHIVEVRCSDRHVRGYFAHVQFEDTRMVDEAMKKQGEEFMGVKIQIDYAYMDKVAFNPKLEAEAPSSRRYRPKSVKPPNGHTLWVGDVSIEASEQDLIDLFEPCGEVEMICLQVNQLRNGKFGHIKFFETEAVDKAAALAGSPVHGVPIRVDFAEDKPLAAYRVGKDRTVAEAQRPEDCRTIWVGGLPSEISEEELREYFGKCGEIREIRLDKSKRSGTLFCHIEFADSPCVDRAIRLSGERLGSSKIRVDFAENRGLGLPPMKKGSAPGPPEGWVAGAPPPGMPPPGMGPPGWMGHGPPPHGYLPPPHLGPPPPHMMRPPMPGMPMPHHGHPGHPGHPGMPPPGAFGGPPPADKAGAPALENKDGKAEECRMVWVDGFAEDTSEDELREFFGKCGDIKEIRLDKSKPSGALCHIEFAEAASAAQAVKLSGEQLGSSKIRADFADNRGSGLQQAKKAGMPGPPEGWVAGAPPPGMPPPGMGPPGWMGHGPPPHGYLPPPHLGPPPPHMMRPPMPGMPMPHHGHPGHPGHPGMPPPGAFGGPPPDYYGRPPGPDPYGRPPPGYPHYPPPNWRPPGGPEGHPYGPPGPARAPKAAKRGRSRSCSSGSCSEGTVAREEGYLCHVSFFLDG
ncbi:unnamed protein product [Cladocopium goreaui]|uniref:Nucleolin 2 n=1 Tax=Cladocopium goreaui TaxID=2562237 RepID=A0A9P1G176_9DINO|nr:unnamed protein product [Cladocopium goreaui]